MIFYATIQVCQTFLFASLGPAVEVRPRAVDTSSSVANAAAVPSGFLGLHKSKWIVLKLSLLFIIDSFAGSFILQVINSTGTCAIYYLGPATFPIEIKYIIISQLNDYY